MPSAFDAQGMGDWIFGALTFGLILVPVLMLISAVAGGSVNRRR